MQPLPGYQDLFPILPSFQHAPRLQIRAAFISPVAETPDIHAPSIRQHVMRSQNQAPFVLYTLSSYPFAGHSTCDLSRYWWDLSKQPMGLHALPQKRESFPRITVSKHSRTCMMALLFWSTWQARNVLLFCSLEDRPRASAWLGGSCLRPTFLRPLLLIREIKKNVRSWDFGGGCAKERKEQTQLFSYVALDTDVENKHKSDKTRLK